MPNAEKRASEGKECLPDERRWYLSHRGDAKAGALADRHYSRQKSGTPQFMPPGRCLVLWAPGAVWGTSWPYAEFVKHAWGGAWLCSIFRNESGVLSSELIREAVAISRWRFGEPPALGMVTFVDPSAVRHKRDPGRCFLGAGFVVCGACKDGKRALQLLPEAMPGPLPPLRSQLSLWEES